MKTGIIYCPNHRPFMSVKKRWEMIEAELRAAGIEYDLVQSEDSESVERLVNMLINNGYDNIVIAGGDSALNDAANCLMRCERQTRERIALGIIPNGVMNDFAGFWGFHYNHIKSSVASIAARRIRKIDIGIITYQEKHGEECQRYFLNSVNIGLLAAIQRLRQQMRKRFWSRKLSFALSFVMLFFQKMTYKMEYTIDNVREQHRVMTLCVGNAHGYGQTPNATPYNGMLDITVMRQIALLQIVSAIYLFVKGKILTHKYVLPYRTTGIELQMGGTTPCSIDGHPIESQAGKVTMAVLNEQINFIIEKK